MDMTCRCKGFFTCVACKVKRGDYRDWMRKEMPGLTATAEHRRIWEQHREWVLKLLGRTA